MGTVSEPKDLTAEAHREYDLGDRTYRVVAPQKLWIGTTTHRVLDADGIVHCVPFPVAGGRTVVLRWEPRDAASPVQF